MTVLWKRCAPMLLVLMALCLIEGGFSTDYADARSKSGGKSFSKSPSKAPASTPPSTAPAAAGGGFSKGLMGGLLGGAIGGMLFGSMFGAAGSGMGILPLLLLAGGAFFLYRRFAKSRQAAASGSAAPYARQETQQPSFLGGGGQAQAPPMPVIGGGLQEDGLAQLKQVDRNFDENHFLEVATDVFFQVQAGWMRRDIESYRYLLGEELAREYEDHLAELRAKGHINKLESIAVRETAIVSAGSDGGEDFVTVLLTANLLDYTVDDKSGDLVSGSMTVPVKFKEEWTWARPTGTDNWRLEGVREV
jgi:predicted lipid-binding transport protein (Tim44 family)